MALLFPKRTKYRKLHRGRRTGKATRGQQIAFGEFGIQSLEAAWITQAQIEACRTTITRTTQRGAQLWIRIFPDKSITKHPAEARMGKGKGPVDHWVAVVRPGSVLFEISGLTEEQAKRVHYLVGNKLPVRTRLKRRTVLGGEV
ncbi:MAG: 50S ribosomal protein L16 [Candidatus Bipolaricaulis sp.]|nr:50S ribosomal protein L16 [Candidatus Bipolaricaulis sp.]MDD5219325.1 50S ribosomal protein L16 [Candidatus Bipolaricaulis sp.]MDD5646411.1 50S ribosomal protein L16 [Candidatus Bipolaricaulis sp.]